MVSSKEDFENVSLVDGYICGLVGGIFDVYKYKYCPKCRCKIDDYMKTCGTCKSVLNEKPTTLKYELILVLENGELFFITGFLPTITNVTTLPSTLPSNEEIEDLLNQCLEGKEITVEYTTNKKTKEKVVHKVTFKN